MFEFVFSGFFNFVFSVCLFFFLLFVLFMLRFGIKLFKAIITGKNTVKYSEDGEEFPLGDEIRLMLLMTVLPVLFMSFLYYMGNGFNTPAESMKIYAQEEQEAKMKKIQEKERKEQEKLEKEERKKQEKLTEEKKEVEEKAEKERLKQEKIAAERQAKIDAENADKNNHDFIEISAVALMNELEANAARTKNNFDDRYVKITNGTVTNIESDGDYVTLNSYGLANIQCFPKYQSTREQIFALNNGQHITVYGKITHVGEIAGFSLELLKIE